MKNAKRFAAVLLTVVLVAGMLTGCKDALAQAVRKVLGTSSQAEEADTTRWAEATADPLMIEGIADPSAKYDSAITNGRLNVVFNGIWSRKTSYFTAPNGSITLTGCGTAEGVQRFKVASVEKAGRRSGVCGGEHPLYPDRRHQLPLHHCRAGPGGYLPAHHLV